MGTVTEVLVREGEVVRRGDLLVRLDTRDLTAKDDQVRAGLAAAVSRADEAERYAVRIRALYADSAAPKALLDGAEAGLAQAEAGLAQARGARARARRGRATTRWCVRRSPASSPAASSIPAPSPRRVRRS